MKRYPPRKPAVQEYTLVVPTSKTLRFDSHFESGNLSKAIKVSDSEYNLFLEFDTETQGYTQWFYFAVETCQANHSVRFNILNLMKGESLYSQGLKPAVYSCKDPGWRREGNHVACFSNHIPRKTHPNSLRVPPTFFTLTFTYTFKHEGDRVYFAHSVPYTHTDLTEFLQQINTPQYREIAVVSPLCTSLAGNTCYMVTITQHADEFSWETEKNLFRKSAAARRLLRLRKLKELLAKQALAKAKETVVSPVRAKKVVVLTARVHPGEVLSSFMMKGVLEFLVGDSREARILRKHYIFKIIPMLNPDGVIYGNYRCSLLGVDLNRRWKNPSSLLHPIPYTVKKLIEILQEEHEITMFCDMHSHTIKTDAFIYGCRGNTYEDARKNLLLKMVPFFLARTNKLFSFKKCHFSMQALREATARVVAFNQFEVTNSYTLEASFFGPSVSQTADGHFSTEDLESLGRDLVKQLLMFTSPTIFFRKLRFMIQALSQPNDAAVKPMTDEAADKEKNENKTEEEDKNEEDQCEEDQYEEDQYEEDQYEEDKYEESSESQTFHIGEAINELPESELIYFEEEEENSAGSDSCPSDNDDRKIEFLTRKRKPSRQRTVKERRLQRNMSPELPLHKPRLFSRQERTRQTPSRQDLAPQEQSSTKSRDMMERLREALAFSRRHEHALLAQQTAQSILAKNRATFNLSLNKSRTEYRKMSKGRPGFLISQTSRRRPYYN